MAPRWFGPLDRLDRLDHGVMNGDPRLSVALYYELIISNYVSFWWWYIMIDILNYDN